ncbi:MAG: peptide chain release factor N(5)-glutamine methyltransferase [Chitinispirillaceae bacterium]|nr:peptide chain release factor N(5)-glutamine methyltransferase [Chitinispirillaceae bacterium]
MTISEALTYLQKALVSSSGELALPHSEEILCTLTGLNRFNLYLSSKKLLSDKTVEQIRMIIERMLSDEPLQYILESAYFYNREFLVSPSVLIPRPDTETLVEAVLKKEKAERKTFLDIGTGSGIIACLLTELKPWKCVAIDISINALNVAQKNRRSDIAFLCCDLFNALRPLHQFDFIVSNPPYIKDSLVQELDNSVKAFEPHLALRGGDDGLKYYRQIAYHGAQYIRKDGHIYCEIGYDQEEKCKEIFKTYGWRNVTVIYDLGNNPRVITAQVPELDYGE